MCGGHGSFALSLDLEPSALDWMLSFGADIGFCDGADWLCEGQV
jgi:hypothetical protein